MAEAAPVHVQELVVALDYAQFYLLVDDRAPDLVEEVLHRALAGDGIAQGGGLLVVLVPHQNNFEMPLRVERWNAEPPGDLDAWQEAFTASIQVGSSGVWYQSPTLSGSGIEVPAGRYDLRICGRGFVNRGWPGSTTPGDVWRFQLWPTTVPGAPRRLRAWPGPTA